MHATNSTSPPATSPTHPPIRPPAHPSDGTVPFLSGERIAFSYLTSQKFTGDVVALDILREGKPLQLQIKVRRGQRWALLGC